MFTEEERAKWRDRVARWRNGELVYDAGRIVEKSDNTSVQKQEPVAKIKRDFIAEATRKHAAEAVGPDTRSLYLREQSQSAKQYANQQYQKAKDDAKRAEGLELMMKTVSPATYIEAATGLDLGEVGRLAADAIVFGLPGAITKSTRKAIKPLLSELKKSSNPYHSTTSNTKSIAEKIKNGSDFDFDTKDLFNKMRSVQIRGKLAQIKSPEPDLANDPFGIRNLASDVIHHEGMPDGVEDIFRYQILPRTNINPLEYDRTISTLSKYGYNTLDDYNWAKYVDEHTAGYLDGSTKAIALRDGYYNYAGAHEFRHRMQRMIPYKRSLAIDRESYLNKAYGDDFVNLPKNVDPDDSLYGYELMADEKATTNLDARKWAFENLTDNPSLKKASVREQNEFLNKLSDDQIIESVVNSNGYGKKYIHFLELKYHLLDNPKLNAQYANWFRNAMKYYGVASIPVTMSIKNTRNEPRNK